MPICTCTMYIHTYAHNTACTIAHFLFPHLIASIYTHIYTYTFQSTRPPPAPETIPAVRTLFCVLSNLLLFALAHWTAAFPWFSHTRRSVVHIHWVALFMVIPFSFLVVVSRSWTTFYQWNYEQKLMDPMPLWFCHCICWAVANEKRKKKFT